MSAQEERLTAIATAIREKDGTTGLIPASDFAARILAIKTGSDFTVPLIVTAEAGAVVTAVNGDTILTATANENDTAAFSLEKPGEWSIEAFLDGRTLGPKMVQVTDQYEAEFSFVESRLPKGYTEVEYIQTNRFCGFNTGIIASTTTRLTMDMEIGAYVAAQEYIFAASSLSPRYLYCRRAGSTLLQYGSGSSTASEQTSTAGRKFIDLNFPDETLFIGDSSYSISSPTTTNVLYILKHNSSAYSIAAKLYSAQMYEGDTQIRDFVPCINPDGIVGLYDLVEGVFYQNAWNGTLTAGPTV